MHNIKTYFNIIKHKPLYYICSFPKSGRTWLRFILGNYINLAYNLKQDIDFHSIFTIFPNDSYNQTKGINAYRFSENTQFPLILFSHSPYKFIRFQNYNIVFLLRSIPDVIVSYYFHMTKLGAHYQGSLKSFIRDSDHGLIRYINYINTWAPVLLCRPDILIITYEKCQQNTIKTVQNILSFTGIPFNRLILQEALKLSSFKAMQTIEESRGIAGHDYNYNDIEARRIRRGIVGGYSDYFDKDDLCYIKGTCEDLLASASKILLYRYQVEPYSDDFDTITAVNQ